MKLNTGRTQLYSAIKTLRLRWDETKPNWTDSVCKSFEEEYYLPLDLQVSSTLQAIDRLSGTLAQMRQECE